MSRRIEIELTSARQDGSWTWRAAGAREPKGVLDNSILPSESKVGDVLRVDAEFAIDGIGIIAVVPGREKAAKSGLLELLPSDKPFEAVTSQLAVRERSGGRGSRDDDRGRGSRGPRRERGDRPRSERDGAPGRGRDASSPRGDRPDRPQGARPRADRPQGDRPQGDRSQGDRRDRDRRDGARPQGRGRPNFTPPPELPQRPKPKRLKPGRAHRNQVLAGLPEEQRPVAERALQGGIPAVRQAVNEQNARLRAEGKETVPADGLLRMAEQLLPTLRVAEWLDRADAAKADLDDLDLRDLRSVVTAGDDPVVARDESTRALASELRAALAVKQEKEMQLWLQDIEAALGVGRVIRALKLSGQPPKAGVRFPAELATRLVEAANAALTPDDTSERWSALLEAVAFSPVRSIVAPAAAPTTVTDDLTTTVKRLAPLLPQVASLFGIEVGAGAPMPKPLRPTRAAPARKPAKGSPSAGVQAPPDKPARHQPAAEPTAVPAEPQLAAVEQPVAEQPVVEQPVAEQPVAEQPVAEQPVAEQPVAERPVAEQPAEESAPAVSATDDAAEA